jgi:hypothetical protein
VKSAPVAYEILPPSRTDWDDRANEQSGGPWAPKDFWGPDFPSPIAAPTGRQLASGRLSSRGTGETLTKSARVCGLLMMALAASVVVLDCLINDREGSVFAAALVGMVFTMGAFLALPRK